MKRATQIRRLFAVWAVTGLALAFTLGAAMDYRKQADPDVCLEDLIGQQKIGIAVVGSSLARFGLPDGPELAMLAPSEGEGDARRLTRSGPWPEEVLRIVAHALDARPDYLLIQADPLVFQIAPLRPPPPLRAATRGMRNFAIDTAIPFVHPLLCDPIDQQDASGPLDRVFDGELAFGGGAYPIRMHERDYGAELREIIDEARHPETRVYLFTLPRSETGLAALGEEGAARLNDAITRLHRETGLPLLSLPASLPDSHFFDHAHPNRAGREVVTRLMRDCLARAASSPIPPDGSQTYVCGAARGG